MGIGIDLNFGGAGILFSTFGFGREGFVDVRSHGLAASVAVRLVYTFSASDC